MLGLTGTAVEASCVINKTWLTILGSHIPFILPTLLSYTRLSIYSLKEIQFERVEDQICF